MVFHEDDDFLDVVETVARIGATKLIGFWRTLEPGQVSFKAENDLVSAADHETEAAIVAAIRERCPEHRILSEEAGWQGREKGRTTWIVDPLDGTTNFVHGFPHFCISIGVMVDGRIDFAVILDPLKGDLFRAARGRGATHNGETIRVSERRGLPASVLATGFPFKAHGLLDTYLDIFREVFLGCKAIRRPGSAALDLAYTAAGIFDGFFEFRLSPWDIAGGSLLVEEAGGTLTDMAGGTDWLDEGNVVCGPPGVHGALLEITRKHLQST